ncbi:MAG: hypothetical protein M5U28_10010 [Sandaracinaceae bacterium]|nr:hypothetical protein [Sandaracinaceae bacterium]
MRSPRWVPFAACCSLLACGGELYPAHVGRPAIPDEEPRAKDPGNAPSRLRVAVVSDLNGGYGSRSYGEAVHGAVTRILELSPDLVLSTRRHGGRAARGPRLPGDVGELPRRGERSAGERRHPPSR